MTALAANSKHLSGSPLFILASNLHPGERGWNLALGQVASIRRACAPILGFDPELRLAASDDLKQALEGAAEAFVIPAAMDLSIWHRETLGEVLAEARRKSPHTVLHHDDVDAGHPLLVSAFANQVGRAIAQAGAMPQHCGLILAAVGNGDAASRAESFRLMRLLWEELSLAKAEVGFVRHPKPFLPHVFESCNREVLRWVVLPQAQWESDCSEFTRVMLENFQRTNPDALNWMLAEPLGDHELLTAWYSQRITTLWKQKREREAIRIRSAKSDPPKPPAIWTCGRGVIASVPGRDALAAVLKRILPEQTPERVLVKVTWHGYSTGTFTDPAALDLLLSALPAPAIILEGHTSSRNLGGAGFNWETEAQANRAWIRQQEAEYLKRTGLADVIGRHGAQYVNVTEAYWDGDCGEDFIPCALLPFRGSPMISFAKMKGPTRLGISNLFGLLPEPLRARWHGPNITYFARVCCDVAKRYGALFPLSGVVEGLYSAVRWNRQGLYRSRWGNYDLIQNTGLVTASADLVTTDILASRLQGQDVNRSGFFDVVRQELGWDAEAAEAPLPEESRLVLV